MNKKSKFKPKKKSKKIKPKLNFDLLPIEEQKELIEKWENLTIINNFMFLHVFKNKNICSNFLSKCNRSQGGKAMIRDLDFWPSSD